jgi:hypothetical protein
MSFSVLAVVCLCVSLVLVMLFVNKPTKQKKDRGPQKGAFTGAVAGNSSLPN